MDDAMVRAAVYVIGRAAQDSFLAADCKGVLRDIQVDSAPDKLLPLFSEMRKEWFTGLPQARLLIDAPQDVREHLAHGPYFEPTAGTAREGMKTFDNERFIRLPWEVAPSKTGPSSHWRWLSKGGEFSFFYSDIHLVLNWKEEGAELKQVNFDLNGSTAQVRQASTYWGLPGATYSRRSSGFSARALPEGCIFTSNGPAILPLNETNPLYLLGWVNSRPIRAFIHLNAGAYDNYSTGTLKRLPWKVPSSEDESRLSPYIEQAIVKAKLECSRTDETSRWFTGFPLSSSLGEIIATVKHLKAERFNAEKQALAKADEVISNLYGFPSLDWANELLAESDSTRDVSEETVAHALADAEVDAAEISKNLLSFFVGIVFGRWQSQESNTEAMHEGILIPFATPPSSPPGLAETDAVGKSARSVIALDRGTPGDLVAHIEDLIRSKTDNDDRLEASLLRTLKCSSLAEYFSRRFFEDHLQKYTKSKRQAPIYWPLSTISGDYTLWFYYPALTSQTLYTAINDFVEPKLKQVGADVTALRNKGAARTRDDEKQFESLQAFELELIELRDTLLKLAPTYKPNHDDGVQICAAPLWPLFRHKPWQKVLKDTWEKLKKGDYDWAHLAMNYWPDRVREKCKTDKSLAIAHGLEDLYEEPEAKPRKTHGRKKGG